MSVNGKPPASKAGTGGSNPSTPAQNQSFAKSETRFWLPRTVKFRRSGIFLVWGAPNKSMEIIKDCKFLRKKSKKIKKIDEKIRDFVFEMVKVMEENRGVGLSAPQVGRLERIIIVRENDGFSCFVNPVILKKSKEKIVMEEGCLSLPQARFKIKRPKTVKIKALNFDGKEKIFDLNGLDARVAQHEIDHLNGILITDKISWSQKIKNYFNFQE